MGLWVFIVLFLYLLWRLEIDENKKKKNVSGSW